MVWTQHPLPHSALPQRQIFMIQTFTKTSLDPLQLKLQHLKAFSWIQICQAHLFLNEAHKLFTNGTLSPLSSWVDTSRRVATPLKNNVKPARPKTCLSLISIMQDYLHFTWMR
ncbi:hypothetical protein BS47DRAFT_1401610 [Hydnum rufescens UP504]|uniref:Uncharacterized protein n=1 Tax=Hydnum rufescens UP504 TaxID=1448309 RepID=A0A9P6DN44_9AGAM|nr:hypothetical protein BS47DRAFT_1401610 [Hydnum rufescens UP504]